MSINSWKATDDAILRALFAEGKTDAQIARALKRTGAAVERRRSKLLLHKADTRAWEPEAIASLGKLWGEGHSCAQIAKQLGVTRNAVIGKANRLGLEGRAAAAAPGAPRLSGAQRRARSGAQKSRKVVKLPRPVKPPKAARGLRLGPGFSDTPKPPIPPRDEAFQPLPGDTHRPWEERGPKQCKWPLDVDGQTFSCCRPSGERTYCETHARLSSRGPIAERARSLDDIGQWKRRRAA